VVADNRTDWADERHRRIIEEQRKFLWAPEQLERLACWIGFKPGWTIVDVGCGYGYVGTAYAPFMSPGGRIIGVDREGPLLEEARARAAQAAGECTFEFVGGEAYSVPLTDEIAEGTFCQTLLMHLAEPEKALAEMVRLAKEGGVVVCIEPDNSPGAAFYASVFDFDYDDRMEAAAFEWHCHYGRIARGKGDPAVGSRVPELMHRAGLVDVEARQNEKVWMLVPPYEAPNQQHFKRMIRDNFERREEWREEVREDYLAGGGEAEAFERYWEKWGERGREMVAALEREELYTTGSGTFYIFKARKPAA
jgi:ubiquinone/menaquinone biosynthesis C-methylase UbiE